MVYLLFIRNETINKLLTLSLFLISSNICIKKRINLTIRRLGSLSQTILLKFLTFGIWVCVPLLRRSNIFRSLFHKNSAGYSSARLGEECVNVILLRCPPCRKRTDMTCSLVIIGSRRLIYVPTSKKCVTYVSSTFVTLDPGPYTLGGGRFTIQSWVGAFRLF